MEFYIEILLNIKNAVIDDDVDSYQRALMNYIEKSMNCEATKQYQQNAYVKLGSINLICLACKSSAVKVLEYLLMNENHVCILPYLTKKCDVLPEEEDEECHNAIYYAIRSNKKEILEILLSKWLNDYFQKNSDGLDDLLSQAFNDLTVRNVCIDEEMRIYVKSKLADFRFFDEVSSQKKNKGNVIDIQNLKDLAIIRIDSVVENIINLGKQFRNMEPNEQFILSSKYIAKNIHMLKSCLKCASKLPWEEIEFCLTIFIRSCQNCFQQYPLYHFIINKERLLMHLVNFSDILIKLKDKIKLVDKCRFGMLVIDEIENIENIVDFKELHDDFRLVRDLYSLEKIKSCIDLAMSANITEKCDQLVIVRALQVIGECMKSTTDSPNLSTETYELLLSFLPDNIKEVITKLRDDLSHEECLFVRYGIEMSEQNVFQRIQSDITEMNLAVSDILLRKKTMIVRKIFSKLRDSKDVDAMKLFLTQHHISAISLQKELIEAQNLNLSGIEQLENLVLELKNEIKNQINNSIKLFRRIQDIVQMACAEKASDANGSFEGFKSYMPSDREELLKIYSDFGSIASNSLQTEIGPTDKGLRVITKFNMPENVEKYREIFIKILDKYRLKTLLYFLHKMNCFLDFSDLSHCIPELERNIEAISIEKDEIKNFKRMITNLRTDCDKKANRVEEMFLEVQSLIQSEKTNFKHTQNTYLDSLKRLISIIQFDNEEYSQVLETRMLDFQERFQSLALPQLSKKFSDMFQKITSELVRENFARGIPFLTALSKIHIFLEFRLGKTKWIKEFKQILQNQEENKLQKSLQKIPKSKKLKPLLSDKLSLLEQIVKEYHENKQFFQKSQCSQKKLKLLSIIEMLTLDSFSILGCKSLPNRLTHNAFFLDKYYPVINGKNLRNHLAHGNALVSIVLEDECADILLNAEKMRTYDLLKSKQEIGKKVKNDPQMIKTCLDTDLSTVSQQLKLFAALSEGKKEKVKDYISKGADVFGRDMRSQTSLHFAAKGPCLETVKFLLKFNLDVYAVDFNLQTALHVASSNGRLATVKYLVQELNSLINYRDICGRTPLHLASINGHTDVVKYLLKDGAEMSYKDLFGNAALHYAIIRNHLTIASILLEKIVDANKTFFGDTALHLASGKGHMNLVITLLDKISVNFRSDLKFTPLHYAARGGHADVVQLLISKGAEVDAKTLKGATPLHLAAEKGHNTVVEILLQYGADINATDFNGFTALCFAVKGGFLATSKFLLEREMVVDSVKNYIWDPLDFVVEIRRYFLRISKPLLGKDKIADGIKNSSYKPLILAAQFGHYELVEILLHRCNTSSKLSALHWAALKGHLRIVELLINNEINAECDDSGCTALHLAAYEGHTEIVNFLISKGYIKRINSKIGRNELEKNSNCEVQDNTVLFINGTNDFDDVLEFSGTTALQLSAFRKHKDIVRCLLKNQADIYIKDDIGTTPLQAIIVNGMADILIDESISINFTDCGDSSPLMLGTSQGDLMFVEYCIGKGIHKGCVEDAKNKALAVAVYFGHEDVMNCLIKYGACVNASSPDGFTPLDLAVEAKRWNIVRVLIDDKKAEMSVQKERKYLLSAIKSGHEDIVEYFLARHPENGASSLECREFPLHTAVQYGHLNIVKKLLELEKRTDINDTNENFATPLQLASGQGYSEITRLLILNGADPNVPDHNPPLHLAVANSDYEMIEVLIEAGANATLGDEDGISAIGLAIKCKSLDVMETLLELSEIDINFKGDNDRTFLHDAAVSGSLQIIKSLIEKGAATDARDSTGVKPIHMAAKEGYQDIVEYFLGEGIDVGDIGENGWCLLHYAAAGNQTEICEFLLRNGLNVNTVDAHGCSPLHIAAQLGKTEVFHILLRYGAYYDFLNERNETPLNVAMASSSTNNFPIIASLIFITSLFSAVEKKDLRKVRASLNELLRLSKMNYIDIKNAENISLLNYAEQKGCAEIVDFLLKCSVDGNDRPSNLSIIKSILKVLIMSTIVLIMIFFFRIILIYQNA
ncbi:uncharacterized protein LOC129975930 [Argiope bruennichi]|uniref:uncharacterized protein LOC129975930 n=1 Tax=Argiope bruennichi TaxID=94029 RepID=UPI002494CC5D|nr:uncharacterized protein LOC129975930 [Argiope bruennichi]